MAEPVASAAGIPERIGRHPVVAYIATGGMAELFLGKDPSGKPVVIKRILPHLARQSSFVSMFIDEARIGSSISHPNLVDVHELGQIGTDLFLVMEYLEGENLSGLIRRLLARGERLPDALSAWVIAQACAGLHAAHELKDEAGKSMRIVHRDVSPQNIFVTYSGAVKVLDFGVATAAHRLTQTATGQLKGKFSYMSPEQCRGEALDARSDIFSLGVVLYELSMLRRLFKRPNELMVLKAVTEDPIPRPSRERPDFPRDIEDIVMRSLERDRTRRFATAAAMQGELLRAIALLGANEDPSVALAREMHRLFEDRIGEKRRMLSHVRAGTNIDLLPAVEADEGIDVPQVSQQSASVRAPSHDPTKSEKPRKSKTNWFVVLLVALLLVGAAWGATYYLGTRDELPVVATPPTTGVPTAAAPESAPPPAPEPTPTEPVAPTIAAPEPQAGVTITINSTPEGATVIVDGRERGKTPLDLSLPRGTTPHELELRRSGYTSISQDLVPDRDQRFVLALAKAKKQPTSRPPKSPPKDGGSGGFHRFD